MESGEVGHSPPPLVGVELINKAGSSNKADSSNRAVSFDQFEKGLGEVVGTALSNGRRITTRGDKEGKKGTLAVKDLIATYQKLTAGNEKITDQKKAEVLAKIMVLDQEASAAFAEKSTMSKAILAFKQAFTGTNQKAFRTIIDGLKGVNQAKLDEIEVYMAARKVGKNKDMSPLTKFIAFKLNPSNDRNINQIVEWDYSEWKEKFSKEDSEQLYPRFFEEIKGAGIDENSTMGKVLKEIQADETPPRPKPRDAQPPKQNTGQPVSDAATRPPAPNHPPKDEDASVKGDEEFRPPLPERDAPPPQRAEQQAAERGQAPEPPSVNKPEGPNGPPPALPPRPRTFTPDPQSMNPPTPPKRDVD